MSIPINSTLTFISFGLITLLFGGFVGGEIATRRQTKAEIKEIQQKQNEILGKMEMAQQLALENEKKALDQIDSIYNFLGVLATKEAGVRSNINKIRDRITNNGKAIDKIKEELGKQSKDSGFSFYRVQ